jgi:hypothetical protein
MTTPTVTERIIAREPVTRDDFADEPAVAPLEGSRPRPVPVAAGGASPVGS